MKFEFNSTVLFIGVYLFSIYFIYQILWFFLGETIFEITDSLLIIKSGIAFIKSQKNINRNAITNIRVRSETSKTYWGFQGVRFYDGNIDVLVFDYSNTEFVMGTNLSDFDAYYVKKQIAK